MVEAMPSSLAFIILGRDPRLRNRSLMSIGSSFLHQVPDKNHLSITHKPWVLAVSSVVKVVIAELFE
jgi:hypothetical protein